MMGSRAVDLPTGKSLPGVAARAKMASSSASLDPTLDQSAMLRTEHLVYGGSGRNIFSAIYASEPAKIPKIPVAGSPRKTVVKGSGGPTVIRTASTTRRRARHRVRRST